MTTNRPLRMASIMCLLLFGWILAGCSSRGGEITSSDLETQDPHVEPVIPSTSLPDTRKPMSEAVSDVTRDIAPDIPETDFNGLLTGNTEFAFDLYQRLSEEEGNLFFSPYSISMALAMTYAGASADTETQMARTMHFTLTQDQIHPAFNRLDLLLSAHGQGEPSSESDQEQFKLSIANSIWGQEGYPFLPEFLDTLAENYGAGIRIVDYVEDAETARLEINQWVSDQTEDRIKDLIPQGVLNSLTRLVLANAIYFKAPWLHQFDPANTTPAAFNKLDGSIISVPMMTQTQSFGYIDGESFFALELPYQGGTASMIVIVPEPGTFQEAEQSLYMESWRGLLDQLEPTRIRLSMPLFEYESSIALKSVLESMGMVDAFSIDAADFSGMDGTLELYILDLLHKAFVAVDEEGTEAAAATAVIMSSKAMLDPPIEIQVDRPFVFMIRDLETNSIIFMGRVLDPSQ